MKHIVVTLPIDVSTYVEYYADYVNIAASHKASNKKGKKPPEPKLTPEIAELREKIYSYILDYGFSLYRIPEKEISNRGGGCSTYRDFKWEDDDVVIKLVVNIRVADHDAKPNLARMRKATISTLSKQIPDSATAEFSDIYRTTYNWGYMVYVGGDTEYNVGIEYKNTENHKIADRKLKQAIKNRLDTLMKRI